MGITLQERSPCCFLRALFAGERASRHPVLRPQIFLRGNPGAHPCRPRSLSTLTMQKQQKAELPVGQALQSRGAGPPVSRGRGSHDGGQQRKVEAGCMLRGGVFRNKVQTERVPAFQHATWGPEAAAHVCSARAMNQAPLKPALLFLLKLRLKRRSHLT